MNDFVGMEQGAHLRQSLSAGMRQGLEVLQASQIELTAKVQEALVTNPVLEEVLSSESLWEEGEWESELSPDGWNEYVSPSVSGQEAQRKHEYVLDSLAVKESLSEHLEAELLEAALPEKRETIARFFIGMLNVRGLFEGGKEALFAEARASLGKCSEEELELALEWLQACDPAGIGAFSHEESLWLQLRAQGKEESLAAQLLKNSFDVLGQKSYKEWAQEWQVSEEAVQEAMEQISHLSLNPAVAYDSESLVTLVPDVEVFWEEEKKQWSFSFLKPSWGQLRLSDHYKDQLASAGTKGELRAYLKHCFAEGRQLMQALAQREETLGRIMRVLLQEQRRFFDEGPAFLAPLSLTQLAQRLELHVTTISRAVSGKYLQCSWGVFEWRYFFSSSVVGEEGEALSQRVIKQRLLELIKEEDKRSPLSDQQLAVQLAEQGVSLARRTVAKYREQLGYPAAHLRRL